MQFLPKSTSTDVVLALFGINSIETEIDYRTLIFLGQLCRLSRDHTVKEVFVRRLIHYNETPAKILGLFPRYLSYTYKICTYTLPFGVCRTWHFLVLVLMEKNLFGLK